MKQFIVFTVFIITVYQLDAQTKLITVEKGDTILVGADMKIVIPAKQQLRKTIVREYVEPKIINIQLPENNYPQLQVPVPYYPIPVRYHERADVDEYIDSHTNFPTAIGILALLCGTVAVTLVLAERGRRKDEYSDRPEHTHNTFHVNGGNADSSKHEVNEMHDSRTYGEPDMNTANAVVKMWQQEDKKKKENFLRRDDSEYENRDFNE